MVAAAVIGGAVVGAAASSYSGNKAAKATESASKRASNTQRDMYEQTREDNEPFRQVGLSALDKLSTMYDLNGEGGGPDYSEFEKSPDYQFALEQGARGTEQSLARRGLTGSGAEMKALARFNQGLASQQFNNYKNSLLSLVNPAQVATQNTNSAGATMANNVSNNQIRAGDARASSYLNQGAAISNVANTVGQARLLQAGGYLNQKPQTPQTMSI